MLLTPLDIAAFHYCPYLFFNKKKESFFKKDSNLLEKNVIRAIKLAEESCVRVGSEVNPSKIIRKWDGFWWEEAISKELSISEADKYSIKAATIVSDYCKYDVSGYMYPVVGKDIYIQKEITKDIILHSSIDVLKECPPFDKNDIPEFYRRMGLKGKGCK